MRVLLCLVSDQHVPNLLSVHHYKPEKLVLVESTAMKARGVSGNFLNALGIGGLEYGDSTHIEPLGAEDDLAGPALTKALAL